MSEAKKAPGGTVSEGAVKAGDGNNIFKLDEMAGIKTGVAYSSAKGPLIEGDKTMVGLMRKEKGTGARPHSHPNEQWNYIVKGKLRVNIDGEETIEGPGTLLFFPANVVHSTVALPEEDVYFLVVKDASHSVQGIPADGQETGAYFEPGFGPESG
ncbi:MAG: cupin domain-containing protein [Rhodospirillales bacterium]|nr:cupin domain-containing protein [Rhodospirillales bacterium]